MGVKFNVGWSSWYVFSGMVYANSDLRVVCGSPEFVMQKHGVRFALVKPMHGVRSVFVMLKHNLRSAEAWGRSEFVMLKHNLHNLPHKANAQTKATDSYI